MVTRRDFLKLSALAGAGVVASPRFKWLRRMTQAPTLPPGDIPKYATPLLIPPVMPPYRTSNRFDYYKISARQLQQQILPAGMPQTTVWGYGSYKHTGTHHYPSFTIEAKYNKTAQVFWKNELAINRRFLPHLLPVDPTVHWANPAGGVAGRDSRPVFDLTPGPYTGPVPIVTHVHGAHTTQESDGHPEAWFLPVARNIPTTSAIFGTYYEIFKASSPLGRDWTAGQACYEYPNNQRATTLWYHDHTLGMTRLNVYAGPAGFYLIRGGPDDVVNGVLPGPAPRLGDAAGVPYYEIPIAIQDRSFNSDGSLFYPDTRAFFDGIEPPYVPFTDIAPIWNPEFFGNSIVINGNAWPYLDVEPRRYRLRLLNGCNSRFLILKFSDSRVSFWQIGAEGGFLPAPAHLDQLLMSPAERADVIVDFSSLSPGDEVVLLNLGPDEPFKGLNPDGSLRDGEGGALPPADPNTTGQVMLFRVVPLSGSDPSTPPEQLGLPALPALGESSFDRKVSLNEMMSEFADGPAAAMLGTHDGATATMMMWDDPVSETPVLGATETWEIFNTTEDAHPIHIHLVQFQVVNRQPFGADARPPEAWELGYKDTVIALPGEITRVKAKFDTAGLFVWHCHIVEHEDNEMMRPYQVV